MGQAYDLTFKDEYLDDFLDLFHKLHFSCKSIDSITISCTQKAERIATQRRKAARFSNKVLLKFHPERNGVWHLDYSGVSQNYMMKDHSIYRIIKD